MSARLILVGASVRAAAFSALRAGWEPHALDRFADRDLAACCPCVQLEDFADAPRKLADLPPAPWMYTGAMENRPALVDWLAGGRTLYGNCGEALRRVRDPLRVEQVLTAAGLAFPPSRLASAGLPADGSWLRKRLRSAGGRGIAPWRGEPARSGDFFQRRMPGEPCAALYIFAAGEARLLGVTRQLVGTRWTGATEFAYAGSVGPLALSRTVSDQFQRIGDVLVKGFRLSGLVGVDALVDGSTVWTIEINPRYCASVEVLERATGLRCIALHVEACRGRREAGGRRWEAGGGRREGCGDARLAGKAILYARRDVTASAALCRRLDELNEGQPWPQVADLPVCNARIPKGGPILTVLAEGPDEHAVERRLRALAGEVRERWGRGGGEGMMIDD